MKLVDNSQQFDQSPTLEQSFQSAINEGAAVNVFELAQQFKNTNPAFKKPQLVEETHEFRDRAAVEEASFDAARCRK